MFEGHKFQTNPETGQLAIGKGIEEKEKDIFDKISVVTDGAVYALNRAYDMLKGNIPHEKRVEQAIEAIDFDYIALVLKKIVKNSAQAAEKKFEDFEINPDDIGFDNQLGTFKEKFGGTAYASQNTYLINPAAIANAIKASEIEDNFDLNVAHVITHEIIHILGAKEGIETGFTKRKENKKDNQALNEAMTEFLARVVTRAYGDFTNAKEGKRLILGGYNSEVDCLLGLMVLVAKDNNIEIEPVIQAFTTSYFYEDSVVDALSQFETISPEARQLVELLQGRSFKEDFDIFSLPFDEESKKKIENLQANRNTALKALHL